MNTEITSIPKYIEIECLERVSKIKNGNYEFDRWEPYPLFVNTDFIVYFTKSQHNSYKGFIQIGGKYHEIYISPETYEKLKDVISVKQI